MSKLISPMEPEEFARFVVDALDDLKSVNTVTLDVRDLTDVTDYLVITSGTSSRHVKSLASHVSVEAKSRDLHPLGIELPKPILPSPPLLHCIDKCHWYPPNKPYPPDHFFSIHIAHG